MVERSDRMWSTGQGNSKPLQYSFLENPMNSMKRQKDRTLKDELPRSVGAQYATGDQWRNNSRKNEGMELIIWSINCPSEYISGENKNSKKCTHPIVHICTIYNSQDMGATQVSISRWMDKDAVYIHTHTHTHTHTGMLLSQEKGTKFYHL